MPINATLAGLSNGLLLAAVLLYAVAMLCYACDFAFAKHRVMAGLTDPAAADAAASRAALTGAAVPSLVAAGAGGRSVEVAAGKGGPPTSAPAGAPEPARERASRWPSGFWLRVAFGLTCIAVTAHALAIVTRGIAEQRTPWGNMYEFIAAFTCMAVLVLVVASVWQRAYYLGLFVLIPVVFGLGIDLTVLYTPAGSLVPALQSYWIAIHVTAMLVAIGLFIFGAVVTILYLVADRSQRRVAAGRPSWSAGILEHLPGPIVLDRLSYRSILFAFPVWTFGVMAGAIWADHAWGRYWGWDPKETWSFITWVVYAMFLHARATAGWRGRRAGYIQLIGFTCLLFNVIGVNLWITGLHSYAGMS
jgi:cytochrome c-type biogenesis protein CcsB